MAHSISSYFYYTAPTGVKVEIIGSTRVTVTWQWSGDQSRCWNTTILRYQSGRNAPEFMKLDNPNINSVNVTNLQCGTRYNFAVVLNTTTSINVNNTADIYLECLPSTTPSTTATTPTSVVSTRTPQSE